jgi:hypothetical protein
VARPILPADLALFFLMVAAILRGGQRMRICATSSDG